MSGLKLTNTLPYLYQNFAVRNVLVYGPDLIDDPDPGVMSTGYFGSDWRIDTSEWVQGGVFRTAEAVEAGFPELNRHHTGASRWPGA